MKQVKKHFSNTHFLPMALAWRTGRKCPKIVSTKGLFGPICMCFCGYVNYCQASRKSWLQGVNTLCFGMAINVRHLLPCPNTVILRIMCWQNMFFGVPLTIRVCFKHVYSYLSLRIDIYPCGLLFRSKT